MRLTNTLTGELADLEPVVTGRVGLYVCGVTPYAESHVGHAMAAIIYDVLVRYLRSSENPAGGYDVTYVSNYTDIDDNVIARAMELGRDPLELVAENIDVWEGQQRALHLTFPDVRPRVTEHIETIVAAVEQIVAGDYGYVTEAGDVYFRVRAKADYGKLSHRDIEQLRSGTRFESGEGKEFALDFALWKAAKPGEPSWPSPWGLGRPGWHIECSAMSQHYLGAEFDIHGGGIDLVFPHHENEVAQAEAASGQFARVWLHNGLVQRAGEKMSKSLGNVVTVREALERWRPDALRLFALGGHYRSPNNLTDEAMAAAEAGVDRLLRAIEREPSGTVSNRDPVDASEARASFIEAMEDDLNTPRALAALFDLARVLNRGKDDGRNVEDAENTLWELATGVLGLALGRVDLAEPDTMSYTDRIESLGPPLTTVQGNELLTIAAQFGALSTDEQGVGVLEALLERRSEARTARDFETADAIRAALADTGIEIEDTPTGWQVRVVPAT
jgi:cysteinyl-tRNA synthetase